MTDLPETASPYSVNAVLYGDTHALNAQYVEGLSIFLKTLRTNRAST